MYTKMNYCKSLNIILYFMTSVWIQTGVVVSIIGGHNAHFTQFRYMISIRVNGRHVCGGSFIGEKHALIAAHCVMTDKNSFKDAIITIYAGVHHVQNTKTNGIEINVVEIYVPREYNKLSATGVADIAILKLDDELKLISFGLITLNLPSISRTLSNYENANAVISGYGINSIDTLMDKGGRGDKKINRKIEYKLKFIETTVIDNRKCKDMFMEPVMNEQICAQAKQEDGKPPTGVCDGDSGGPLVIKENIVIGVLSSGPPDCNESEHAGIYTRITSYLRFIDDAMKSEYSRLRVATYKKRNFTGGHGGSQMELIELLDLLH